VQRSDKLQHQLVSRNGGPWVEVVAIERSRSEGELEASFHQRFETMMPRLLAVCRRVIGDGDAEDVVQETYLRAAARIGQLRDPNLFEAWVTRIALNEAKTVLRSSGRRVPLRELDSPAAARGSDAALRELVEGLPIRQRMAVVLYYGYGYRLREVAELLGINEINARTVLFRARRRLRTALEESDAVE
jgi:RNA polymerase sigma factor (sigma-70 family)